MRLPTVSSCCCGCSLRQGSIIIGVVFTASQLAQLILWSVFAEIERKNIEQDDKASHSYRNIMIVSAVISALMLVTNSLLLAGVFKKHPGLVLQWVVTYTTIALLSLISLWVGTWFWWNHNFIETTITISGSLLRLSLMLYCVVVVFSYYRKLQETRQGDLPQLPQNVY